MFSIQPYGDSALLINFEQRIAPEINKAVIQLARTIEALPFSGIQYTIPAYCSLTVGFNPLEISYKRLCETIQESGNPKESQEEIAAQRTLKIPVCYTSVYAPDIEELALSLSLSPAEIIRQHTSVIYRVYMLGFIPGFAYMGRLPKALYCSRKAIPRTKVPAQSVGLAGFQTGIYPAEAPGGWQLIGRTPIPVFDGNKIDPFLFRAGDQVQFYAIAPEEFLALEEQVEQGYFDWKTMLDEE